MIIRNVLLVLICVSALSCRKKHLDLGEFKAYVESKQNGLVSSTVVSEWEYKVQYKPAAYIVLHESGSELSAEERSRQLEGTAWFNIYIKRKGGEANPLRFGVTSLQEYEARYNYFLLEAVNDISLRYGAEILRPISYVFETSYNLAPQEVIVVGFALPDGVAAPSEDMQLVYYDQVFKNGIIKASFDKEYLTKIPQLNNSYE